ncbi:MAG TPA: RluA family pseudouridine synthase, partial [Gemmata sp.]|nr:RluA family pseudouridine synthase [Gemmata sp.]
QVETNVARRLKVGKRVELTAGAIEQTGSGVGSRETGVRSRESGKGRPKAIQGPPHRLQISKQSHSPTQQLSLSAIVYADDSLVVVNKPAGLTTMRHKSEAAEFGERGKKFLPKTLADLLPTLLGQSNRPVVAVHRIDRDTSGLVVFARTRAAAEALTKQFRKHTVDRRYLALTRSVPPSGRIESVFVRDRGDGRRGSSRKPQAVDGKRAVTHVKVLTSFGEFALVECRLETGRTHQVRIHLGEAGTPLCGETVYDRPVNGKPVADSSGASRPMLHAARLGFKHPETGEAMVWEVPPPEDFARLEQKLKESERPDRS